uniref:Uncharacterized protein n=1 Tax=Anguilla anguilla TaxID=7936 RepID=A0A0E9R2Q8_ANGAN
MGVLFWVTGFLHTSIRSVLKSDKMFKAGLTNYVL